MGEPYGGVVKISIYGDDRVMSTSSMVYVRIARVCENKWSNMIPTVRVKAMIEAYDARLSIWDEHRYQYGSYEAETISTKEISLQHEILTFGYPFSSHYIE